MSTTAYTSFRITSLVVLALPGPSFAYAVAVGARAWRQEMTFNALGMGLGGLLITVALALGASQVLAASRVAHLVLQLTGCAYLIYLGIAALRAKPEPAAEQVQITGKRSLAAAVQGFIVETANPNAILFYASLVPQFVDPSAGNVARLFLILGGTFVALQIGWDISLMLGIRCLRSRAQAIFSAKFQKPSRRVSGLVLVPRHCHVAAGAPTVCAAVMPDSSLNT